MNTTENIFPTTCHNKNSALRSLLKNVVRLLFFLLLPALSFAQPANNNFVNATDITSIINGCSANAAYTTVSATADQAAGTCAPNGPNYNVWFKFTATATTYIGIQLQTGGALGSMQYDWVTLWDASLNQLSCSGYNSQQYGTQHASYLGLTPGATYYISVDNYAGAGYCGTFKLCLSDVVDYNFKEGATDLTSIINGCSADAAYTTYGASGDRTAGTCAPNGPNYNRWFKFTATATTFMKIQAITGGSAGSMQYGWVTLWDASLNQLACSPYISQQYGTHQASYLGLTPGSTYYISVENYVGLGYRGTFKMCLSDAVDYDYKVAAVDVTSLINGCSADAAYTTIGATADQAAGSCAPNGPNYNRWFKFTATATTFMRVQAVTGGSAGSMQYGWVTIWDASLNQVACSPYISQQYGTHEASYLGLTPGATYYISVENYVGFGYRGTFKLCLSDAVDYDYKVAAIDVTALINGCSADAAYTTIGATADQAAGTCAPNGPNYNRWFKFTATASTFMNIQVKTGGSYGSMQYDWLTLWNSSLTQVACASYNSQQYGTQEISYLGLTPGATYYISVDNYAGLGYRGTFKLCLSDVVDYNYKEGAIDVTSLINTASANAAYTTIAATPDRSAGTCAANGPNYNRWFKFTATATTFMEVGVLTGGTAGSMQYDWLTIWNSSLTQLACSPYASQQYGLQVASYTGLTPGATYYISVDNYSGLGYRGTFKLGLRDGSGVNYYWVGNGGNWNDMNHWASTSGGAGGAYYSPPSALDNVFFDANSFSSAGQTVTINVNATCKNLNLTGVLNNPTIAGSNTYSFTCSGSWTWATASLTFAGHVTFNGTGLCSVTTLGNTFNGNVTFNCPGATYTVQDFLYATNTTYGQIGLQSGTLNTNGKPVSCRILNCNIADNVRTLDLGASRVDISGSGTACDFRGNTANFTLSSTAASQIYMNYAGAATITMEVGSKAKTIPNINVFYCTGRIQITSGSVATTSERITFRDITTQDVSPLDTASFLYIDNSSVNTNQKTFGNITSSRFVSISGANGTTWGATDIMLFTGTVKVGDFQIYGDYAEVTGAFVQSRSATAATPTSYKAPGGKTSIFYSKIRLMSTFTVGLGPEPVFGLPSGSVVTRAMDEIRILGNIYINNATGITYGLKDNYTFTLYKTATFSRNIITSANTISTFATTATANTLTCNGTIITGTGSTLSIGNEQACTLSLDSLVAGTNSFVSVLPATTAATSSINEFIMNTKSTIQFGASGTSTHTIGRLTYVGSCNGWSIIRSYTPGTAARISFTNAPSINYVQCKDLNITSTNFTVNSGINQGNNTGITFNASPGAVSYYWVGGTAGNTKTGTYSTGNNNNWSNPDNWSLVSGSYTGTNQCIPSPQDNALFDANSFTSATNKTCDIDQVYTYINDLNCTGATAGSYLDNAITSSFRRTFFVSGNVTLVANMTNNYEGVFYFNADAAKTITSNTQQFYGPMVFDNSSGDWTLADNTNINCQAGYGYYADFTMLNGTVRANATTINLEGDFNVKTNFLCGTGKVIFDGAAAQNPLDQNIDTQSSFYDLTILRANGTTQSSWVLDNTTITITHNYLNTSGFHYDGGYQITGNAANTFIMSSGSRLFLGSGTSATLFPTSYVAANITLDPTSTVYFGAEANQTVSGVPDYGNLYLVRFLPGVTVSGTTLRTKTLTELVTVNTSVYMASYVNFYDAGFQISFDVAGPNATTMEANSQFTLGSAGTATLFPVNYTAASVDFTHPSTVVYNAGLNQTIQGLFGAGNASYSHLTCTNSPAAAATKVLNANTVIRGNLLIDPSNVMDVTASNYSITLAGNWTDLGSFTERLGMVTYNGAALQTMSAGVGGAGTETYYDITFNNTVAPTVANGSVTIASDMVISHSGTFTDGVVTANPTTKLAIFNDDATTSGASDNSFVDGKVRKIGNDIFVYPTGDYITTPRYGPIEISAPSLTTDHFTAQYLNKSPNVPYTRTLKEVTLNHVSSAEYWILDRTGGASNITPKLYWDTPRSGGVATPSFLRVTKWDGTKWIDLGNSNVTGNATAGTLQTTSAVTSFSPFTLATKASDSAGYFEKNPLPIDLINFTAKAIDNRYTQLNWTTSTETNNDFFTIERSVDGTDWKIIGTTKGAGNSSQTINYESFDTEPVIGFQYYRLKQTDFDGKYKYSGLVPVKFTDTFYFSLFPNPVHPSTSVYLNLTGITEDSQPILVVVSDAMGRQVLSKVIVVDKNNSGQVTAVDPSNTLSPGIYIVSATSDNSIYKQKLIIR